MNPDDVIRPFFQLDCACGIYTKVDAASLGEAKNKLREKGCRIVGEAHDLHWVCARCAAVEEKQHAA